MNKAKLALGILIAILLITLFRCFHVNEVLKQSLDWISSLGPWAPLIFIGIYILACILFIPGSILTLGAGVIFGVAKGSLIVSVGATLGATAAFLVGRYFAREAIAKKIEGNPKFKAVDEAVAKEGWKIVGLMRLSPILPFN